MMRLLVCVGIALAVGCSGAQKKKDGSADRADLDAPTAEEVAATPCGNPDWSELPEGSDPPE